MLANVLENSIKILKRDKSYVLDKNYSIKELMFLIKYRGFQILRGLFKKIIINTSHGVIFAGRNVTIQYGFLVQTGASLILEENVIINALSNNGIKLGNNVTIAKNSMLQCTGVIANKGVGISIGDNSAVGANSYLGGQGGIEIGKDVIMGPGVMIFSENHNYQNVEIPIRKQGESRKGVKIGDNCWIGAGSVILDGVEISSGCVIAAGAVVTKSFSSNSIIGGVPAKLIKGRV